MSDLKFSCPSCGQHIQCEQSHAGEKLPCPKCAALIRVPTDAEIVTRTSEPAPTPFGSGNVPTLEENFLSNPDAPLPSEPPITEREQEIAAARGAHPAQGSQAVKPRLSFILSGGQAPIAAENESALQHAENPSPESKTPRE
jgi:hypothetical protein